MRAAAARHRGTFLGAAAVVVALDQLTKHWALSALADGPIDLVGSLRLNLVFNDRRRVQPRRGRQHRGDRARSGWCSSPWCSSHGAARPSGGAGRSGSGIVLGGALGNLVDRAFRAGRRVPRGPGRRLRRPAVVAGVQRRRRRPVGRDRRARCSTAVAVATTRRAVIVREVVPEAMAGERVDRIVAMVTGVSRAEVAALSTPAPCSSAASRRASRARSRLAAGDEVEVDVPDPAEAAAPGARARRRACRSSTRTTTCSWSTSRPGSWCTPGPGSAPARSCTACWPATRSWSASAATRLAPASSTASTRAPRASCWSPARRAAYEALVAALSARAVHRRYRALVWGAFDAPRGLIDAPIGRSAREPTRMAVDERGKEARTRYEVLRSLRRAGGGHRAGLHARDRPHPPDPRAPAVDRPPRGGRRPLRRAPASRCRWPGPFLHAEALELAPPGHRRAAVVPLAAPGRPRRGARPG